jgi:hypothetical protein
MADILGQMFFTAPVGSREYGWSEGHYVVGSANLPAALDLMNTLAQARVGMLGGGVSLSYIRVSDRLVFRDSQIDNGLLQGFQIVANPASIEAAIVAMGSDNPAWQLGRAIYNQSLTGEIRNIAQWSDLRCDFPYSGILLRMEGDSTYVARRSLILRGSPDVTQRTDLDKPAAGPWTNALLAYIALLTNGSYGFRALDATGANPVYIAQSPIVWTPTLDVPPVQIPTITYKTIAGAPANWVVGSRVRIRGLRISDSAGNKIVISGIYTVQSNVAGAVNFFGLGLQRQYTYMINPGSAQRQQFLVVPYTKVLSRRWASKRTGVPFDRPTGRRRRPRGQPSTRVDP